MKMMTLLTLALLSIAATVNAGEAQAGKSDIYIVKFYANWCKPCKDMDRNVWPDARVKRQVRKYRHSKVYTVNVDVDKEWVLKYRVTSIPTVILMDKNGVALKRGVGFMTPEQLHKFLDDGVADRAFNRGPPNVREMPQQEETLTFGAVAVLRWVVIALAKAILFFLG